MRIIHLTLTLVAGLAAICMIIPLMLIDGIVYLAKNITNTR